MLISYFIVCQGIIILLTLIDQSAAFTLFEASTNITADMNKNHDGNNDTQRSMMCMLHKIEKLKTAMFNHCKKEKKL